MKHKITKVAFASSAVSTPRSVEAQVGNQSGPPSASASIDKTFVLGAADALQVLMCLSSLMGTHANDSGRVRVYAKHAEERLHVLRELMRPILWNPA
jgi:hypothetical protein